MTRLLGLFAAAHAVSALSTQGSVFDRVIKALEGAMDDAVSAQKMNDDEFKKTECQANELIEEAKAAIPKHQAKIEELTVKQKELRSENEFLSGEAFELDENVKKMTDDLDNKSQVRAKANAKYLIDHQDFTTAVDQLGRALTTLTEGTANLVQVSSKIASGMSKRYPGQASLLQTAAKTGTSGQVIGILTKLNEQFETNIMTIEAQEKEAAKLFADYKNRTEKQIKSESEQSQSNKNRIADNQIELGGVQEGLKSNKQGLADMNDQLKTQSELLKEHTEFHEQLTAESEGLKKAIQDAITLLTSNDAQNTMEKASDHMVFLQLGEHNGPKQSFLSKVAAIKKHAQGKAAGDYGWNAIFEALADSSASVEADQAQAEEKFATCEMQLRQHHAEDIKLKEDKAKNEMEKIAAEKLIDEMQEAIDDAKEEISKSTKEIKDSTNDIRDSQESLQKETTEANNASSLFKQAIAFLKNYKANSEMAAPESGTAAYDTKTQGKGTTEVVAIIEKVETDMMKEIADLKAQTEKEIAEWQSNISDARDRIKSSKATVAESTEQIAQGEATVASTEVFLRAANEGLAAEAAWWGPSPGHKLPTPGEECIAFLGKSQLATERKGDYQKTDKLNGEGEYHTKSKANTDELAALEEMKVMIEGIRNDYLIVQPAGSVAAGSGAVGSTV